MVINSSLPHIHTAHLIPHPRFCICILGRSIATTRLTPSTKIVPKMGGYTDSALAASLKLLSTQTTSRTCSSRYSVHNILHMVHLRHTFYQLTSGSTATYTTICGDFAAAMVSRPCSVAPLTIELGMNDVSHSHHRRRCIDAMQRAREHCAMDRGERHTKESLLWR